MAKDVVKKAFGAEITLKFVANGVTDDLETIKLLYLMTEYDYRNKVLPTIIMSYNASDYEYKRIIENKEGGQFYLKVALKNKLSTTAVSHVVIDDYFSYVQSTSNPNAYESLNEESDQDNYTNIVIGLVSKSLTENLRKSFNGIYADINTSTIIGLALEGTSCVIENIKYDKNYDSIIIPPITTRYKLLEFLQEQDPFFDTKFVYFMDFNSSYLVSKSGIKTNSGDGTLQDIIIDVKDITDKQAFSDGLIESNGAYIITIGAKDYSLSTDNATDKIVDELVAVDDTIDTTSISVKQGSKDPLTKKKFIRSDQLTLIKNELNQGQIHVSISKNNLDGSIFTPNKVITLNHYHEDYQQYNGNYLLVNRKELIKNANDDTNLFYISTELLLQPVTRIIPLHGAEKKTKLSKKGFRRTTNTKDKKNTTTVKKR